MYKYISDKYKYEHDPLKNKYIFDLVDNSIIKKYRPIFRKTIWASHEFLYSLLKNNFVPCKSLVNFNMNTTLDSYSDECFDKLIGLVGHIHNERLVTNDKN